MSRAKRTRHLGRLSGRKWIALAALAPAASVSLQRPQASEAGFFADVTNASRVHFIHQASPTSRKYLVESMGSGVAVFDFNNDGLLDIFLVNGAALVDPMPAGKQPEKTDPRFWNRLYRNNGDGTFTDVTVAAGVRGSGYGMGAAAADYDNDGHTDLMSRT
jgi:hypothetical protein